MADKKIGKVIYFNEKKKLAIVKMAGVLVLGKFVRFGKDIEQVVSKMIFAGGEIKEAKKGQEIGIKTKEKVKEGADVFVIGELTVDRKKREAAVAKEKKK